MSKLTKRIQRDARNFYHAMTSEFRHIISDTAVLFSFIIVSVVVSYVYSYLYSHEVLTDLPVAYVDMDNTGYSRQFIRMMDGTEQVKMTKKFSQLPEAIKAFEKEEVRGIVVVPRNFSHDLQKSLVPTVSVYTDGAFMLYYKQVLTAANYSVAYMGAGVEIKKIQAKGNLPSIAKNEQSPIRGESVTLYNPNVGYGTFLVPVVLVIIFQTTMLQAIGILGGTIREKHLMKKLYPDADGVLGMLPIVMGKAATYLMISIIILIYMMGFVMPHFNIPVRGEMVEAIIYMIPFLLATVYLGLFLLNFFRKREDAILVIAFTSVPVLLLSGFSWPENVIPWYFKAIRELIPTTLGTKGFIAITQMGTDISVIKDYFLELWGLCLFYLVLATLTYRRIYLIEEE